MRQRSSKDDLAGLGGNGSYGFLTSSMWSNPGDVSPSLLALNPASLLGIATGSIAGVVGQGLDITGSGGETLTIPAFGLILKWLRAVVECANHIDAPYLNPR